LAHRPYRVLKAGTPLEALAPARPEDLAEDLRDLRAQVARLQQKEDPRPPARPNPGEAVLNCNLCEGPAFTGVCDEETASFQRSLTFPSSALFENVPGAVP
jgi:hypothetical protein